MMHFFQLQGHKGRTDKYNLRPDYLMPLERVLIIKGPFLYLFILMSCLIMSSTVRAQIKDIPVQSFNKGWEFTAVPFNAASDHQTKGQRGLGTNWSDQFNVQSVDVIGGENASGKETQAENLATVLSPIKDAQWQKVVLPHTAFIEPVPIEEPIEGYAYYKKAFKVPASLKGKLIQLQLEGAMQIAEVWVNGHFVMRHLGGYLPFTIDLTDKISYGKQNSLFIRLDNRANPSVPPGKPVKKLDFIYYSGIYRNVWLHITDPLHITLPDQIEKTGGGGVFAHYLGADKSLKAGTDVGDNGLLKIRTNIMNQDKTARNFIVEQELLKLDGGKSAVSAGKWVSPPCQLQQATDSTLIQTVSVQKPTLWSPDQPYMYTLVTRIIEKGRVIDEVKTKVGLRTIRITKDSGVLINGKPVHINGSNRHMNYPWIGNALSANANIRDAVLVKKAGINALRLAHYPQDPSFYAACDSLGILLIDCIPGWQFFNKAADFQDLVMRDIRQMIRRDRNHPSVFLWEASLNESYPPVDFRIRQAKEAHKEWQDSTDFYTSGDSYFAKAAWDVPYDDWNGDPGDRNNTTYKDRPFLVREYGDYEFGGGESTSRKSRGDGQQAMLQQAWNLQWEHNRNQIRYPRCIGDMTWAFFDGLAGVTNTVEYWGMADLYRIPKFSYYFFQSQIRKAAPMVYIADYWLKTSEDLRKVIVYSNGDSVRLSINDQVFATKRPDTGPDRPYGTELEKGGHPFTGGDAGHLASPPFTFLEVPYHPGALKAETFREGKVVATQTVYTPGKAVSIKLSIADEGVPLKTDGADVVFIRATLMDSAGHPVYSNTAASNTLIQFSISGNGQIVSPDSRMTEAGIASILVQSTTRKGKIRIKAVGDGLKGDKLEFTNK